MGKSRRANKRKSQQPVGQYVTSPKNTVITNDAPSKSHDDPKVKTTASQSPLNLFKSLLSYIVTLGFSLVARSSSGGRDGSEDAVVTDLRTGDRLVTDCCPDYEDNADEWTTCELTNVKNQDCPYGLKCNSCDVVVEVTLKDTIAQIKEVLERHHKMSPNCHVATDKCVDLDSVDATPKPIDNGTILTKPRSSSLLDMKDVVCDTRDLPGDVSTDATQGESTRTSLTEMQKDVICDSNPEPKPQGAVGGYDPPTSLPRTSKPWDSTRAKYPKFTQHRDRLNNLELNWNKHGYSLNEIADAGLLYSGNAQNDSLNCFYCGVTVPNLLKHDDSWIEHAMRSPDCDYIRYKKGQDYLDVIIDIYLDGDMNAVKKAMDAVAAIKVNPKDTSGTTSSTSNSGATGFSLGANGTSYSSGPSSGLNRTFSENAPSTPPRSYRPGLRGGDPCYSTSSAVSSPTNSPHTHRTAVTGMSSQSIPSGTPGVAIPKAPVSKAPVRKPRTPKRQVQAREVRARLDTDMAQRIIKMGHSAQLVGSVIAEQLIYNGDDFRSFTEMMMAVIDAKDLGEAFPLNHYDLGLNGTGNNQCAPTEQKLAEANAPRPQSPPKAPSPPPASAPSQSHGDLDLKSLQSENDRLRETKTCTVCMDQERDVLFIPCGHLVVCHSCSPRLKCCPLCRQNIKGIVKVYLS